MKSAPTDRQRGMAKRRADGLSFYAVASEFETNAEGVIRAVKRVEQYDRGVALLQNDPASIEGLSLVGLLPPLVGHALAENGITRLTQLEGRSEEQLIQLPGIGKRALAQLFSLLEEYRAAPEGELGAVK